MEKQIQEVQAESLTVAENPNQLGKGAAKRMKLILEELMEGMNPAVRAMAKSYIAGQCPQLDDDESVLTMIDKAYELLDFVVYGDAPAEE